MDEELFGDAVEPTGTDDADVVKALVVLRALKAAGLKTPFDFHEDEAKFIWGARLRVYSLDVLTDALTDWIASPGGDFPSVGDMETSANFVIAERQRAERDRLHAATGECVECEGIHWVREPVPDDKLVFGGATHFMRPCGTCPEMQRRYQLYVRGHFSSNHRVCEECDEYRDPQRHKARVRRART